MNTTYKCHRRRPFPRYSRPHYRQAHRWARFANILREVRADAYQRKEEALAWSLKKNTRGFAIPVQVKRKAGFSFGWDRLSHALKDIRHPELEAKVLYDEARDTEDVVLFVHYGTKQGTRKAPIGPLSAFDAQWMVPLLREGLDRWMNIYVVKKDGDTIEGAIAGSWVAAHYWIDTYDDRRTAALLRQTSEKEKAVAAYVKTSRTSTGVEDSKGEIARLQERIDNALTEINAREEVGQPTDRLDSYVASLSAQIEYLRHRVRRMDAERIDEPTVEDWLREDIGLREVAFSDLESSDYWDVQHVV